MTPRSTMVTRDNPPRIVWCATCDAEVTISKDEPYPAAGEVHPGIGPYHHLSVYPDHYVFEVVGALTLWRDEA